MLVSSVQQSESAICIHISPLFGFPSHLDHQFLFVCFFTVIFKSSFLWLRNGPVSYSADLSLHNLLGKKINE